jgi:hypothetical protein
MASNLIHSQQVAGPNGRFVRVLFDEDGSVRVRVEKAGPMVISQVPQGHFERARQIVATHVPEQL